jgi:hypothetical protein
MTLESCDKIPGLSADPAKTCASPETLQNVRDLILGDLFPSSDPSIKALGMDRIGKDRAGQDMSSQSILRIDLPALDSFDKDTKKIECSGKVVVKWYLPFSSRLNNGQPKYADDDVKQGQYSIQPQAGGDGLIYSVDGNLAELKAHAAGMLLGDIVNANRAAQASAPPPPSAAPAQVDAPPDTSPSGTAQPPTTAPATPEGSSSPTAGQQGEAPQRPEPPPPQQDR